MKKIFVIILASLVLMSTLTACMGIGTPKEESTNNAEGEIKQDVPSKAEDEDDEKSEDNSSDSAEKIVSEDGDEFIVDTSVSGEIKEGADAVGSNKLVIGDKTYELPVRMSELFGDGWELSGGEFEDAFEPNTQTSLISFYIRNENGTELILGAVYNDSNAVAKLEDCLLTDISFYTYDLDDGFDFILPGGICKSSTAADVISVYGDPNSTTLFERGYNFDDQLSYINEDDSKLSISFTFNDDGSIYSVHAELGY